MTQQEKEILIADYISIKSEIHDTDISTVRFWSFPEGFLYGDKTIYQLKFTTSLDWIEPVLEKIESEFNRINIYHDLCTIISLDGKREILNPFIGKGNKRIDAIVEAVVQYIQWYNKQNKT